MSGPKRGMRGGRAGVAGRGGVIRRDCPFEARWRFEPDRGVDGREASAAVRLFAMFVSVAGRRAVEVVSKFEKWRGPFWAGILGWRFGAC